MAEQYFAEQDYTFFAAVSNSKNDDHKKRRDTKFGYTVDDGEMQELTNAKGRRARAEIVDGQLEITAQFPKELIGKKVKLFAYTKTPEDGKSFEIEVVSLSVAIDMTKAQQFDAINNTNYVQEILNDLKIITGLTFTIVNGFLQYSNVVSPAGGSVIARNAVTRAFGMSKTAIFDLVNSGGGSKGEFLDFKLNVNQVNAFIKGSSPMLNDKTLGYGMMFVHEMLHTEIGINNKHGRELNMYGYPGILVNNMNDMRKELGSDYGERLSYIAVGLPGKSYLPFDAVNKKLLYNIIKHPLGIQSSSINPPSSGMFIAF